MTNVARHYLFDLSAGTLTRVRQPGLGYEWLTQLSSEGHTTLTTTDAQGRGVILTIASHNDANNDGQPDDWVENISQKLNLPTKGADDPLNDEGDTLRNLYLALESPTDAVTAENQSEILAKYFSALNANNPEWRYEDDDEDGLLNGLEIFELGTRPDRSDTDKGNQPDGADADPLDGVVDWRKSPPPAWASIPLNGVASPSTHQFHDAYHTGTLLFQAVGNALVPPPPLSPGTQRPPSIGERSRYARTYGLSSAIISDILNQE
jgi:hypothetical protein